MKTFFYCYRQNNSGGCFDLDDNRGIGETVWIEATSPEHANQRAEFIGIYFDGVNKGEDCDCCGDRWWPTCSLDTNEIPMYYDTPIYETNNDYGFSTRSYVHMMDGRIIGMKWNKETESYDLFVNGQPDPTALDEFRKVAHVGN